MIHDSNRYNQDVDKLIAGADKMIDEKKSLSEPGTLLSEHQDIVSGLEPLDIQSLQPYNAMENIAQSQGQADMPLVDVKEHKDFQKISMSHQGIRKKIERLAKLGKINKIQIMSLLKDYDESIEKNIENKELYISRRKQELNNKSQELQSKDGAMRKMEKYLKGLDRKLKEREGNINSIVSGSVEKQLSKRLSQEKKLFKKEISETSTLNRELKRKTVFIERERKSIISKQDRVLDDERKKLAEMQTIYDKKLLDLDTERKSFEQKRTSALELLKRAEPISKELEEIRKIRNYVENSKQLIKRELTEDKELKNIMDKAEHTLKAEQDNLDNLVFTKYI